MSKTLPTGEPNPEAVGLPIRAFMYTLDQICMMLQVTQKTLHSKYLFYLGRSPGFKGPETLEAINIAPPDHAPEWRISEAEFMRWLKHKGFKVYARGSVVQ